jgi:hypothetical protein
MEALNKNVQNSWNRDTIHFIMSTPENRFDFLVEYITTKVVESLMKDQGIGLEEALLLFHNSETFEILCNRDTDMYIESPLYVYHILQEEFRRGTIRGLNE